MIVLVCAACSTARPPVPRMQTQVIEGATFTATGDVFEVRVVKHWQGRDATGIARLHGVFAFDQMAGLVAIAGTRAWLTLTSATDDPRVKYEGLRRALDELGTEYRYRYRAGRRQTLNDDTGPRLLLAAGLARGGDFAGASELAERMLRTRLQVYVQRFAGAID